MLCSIIKNLIIDAWPVATSEGCVLVTRLFNIVIRIKMH